MLSFLETIVNFFEMLWDFVVNLVESLVTLLEVIAEAILLPPVLTGYVPAIIGASISAVVGIAVAKLFLGRS